MGSEMCIRDSFYTNTVEEQSLDIATFRITVSFVLQLLLPLIDIVVVELLLLKEQQDRHLELSVSEERKNMSNAAIFQFKPVPDFGRILFITTCLSFFYLSKVVLQLMAWLG